MISHAQQHTCTYTYTTTHVQTYPCTHTHTYIHTPTSYTHLLTERQQNDARALSALVDTSKPERLYDIARNRTYTAADSHVKEEEEKVLTDFVKAQYVDRLAFCEQCSELDFATAVVNEDPVVKYYCKPCRVSSV